MTQYHDRHGYYYTDEAAIKRALEQTDNHERRLEALEKSQSKDPIIKVQESAKQDTKLGEYIIGLLEEEYGCVSWATRVGIKRLISLNASQPERSVNAHIKKSPQEIRDECAKCPKWEGFCNVKECVNESKLKLLNKESISFVLLSQLLMGKHIINEIVEMVWNSDQLLESIQQENGRKMGLNNKG